MIDERGLSVLPISSLGLDYPVSRERVSSGIDELDRMLGDAGYYRGSSILISGTAGTGKSSFAATFADRPAAAASAACTSPSRNPRHRSSATWPPSAATWSKWVQKGSAAVPRRALDPLRPGAAPGRRPQARQRFQAGGGGVRPDHQPDCHRRSGGSQGHADARRRLSQERGDHRALHQPHVGRALRRSKARRKSRPCWTAGCCCATSKPTATARAG